MLAYMNYVHTRGFWDKIKDGVLYRTHVVVLLTNNTTETWCRTVKLKLKQKEITTALTIINSCSYKGDKLIETFRLS